ALSSTLLARLFLRRATRSPSSASQYSNPCSSTHNRYGSRRLVGSRLILRQRRGTAVFYQSPVPVAELADQPGTTCPIRDCLSVAETNSEHRRQSSYPA